VTKKQKYLLESPGITPGLFSLEDAMKKDAPAVSIDVLIQPEYTCTGNNGMGCGACAAEVLAAAWMAAARTAKARLRTHLQGTAPVLQHAPWYGGCLFVFGPCR